MSEIKDVIEVVTASLNSLYLIKEAIADTYSSNAASYQDCMEFLLSIEKQQLDIINQNLYND